MESLSANACYKKQLLFTVDLRRFYLIYNHRCDSETDDGDPADEGRGYREGSSSPKERKTAIAPPGNTDDISNLARQGRCPGAE